MTQSDPEHSARPAARGAPGFNGVVVVMVLVLVVIAGAYVWIQRSGEAGRARDNAASHPLQPAELPRTDAGSPSPDGAVAPR